MFILWNTLIRSDGSGNKSFNTDETSTALELTLLNKNSTLKIKDVGLNSTRTGFYKLLKKNGANIKFKNLKKMKITNFIFSTFRWITHSFR